MKVLITGVSCVGKTSIGAKLASFLQYPFYDLDKEVENFYGKSIEHLQAEFLTMYSFREKASQVLKHLLTREIKDCVIALPPSGLMGGYLRMIKKTKDKIIAIVLLDDPKNILDRITFYDTNSQPIEKQLNEKEKRYYLKEIKKDITYFGRTYSRADLKVDISGLGINESAERLKNLLILNCT